MSSRRNAVRKYRQQEPQQQLPTALLDALLVLQNSPVILRLAQSLQQDPSIGEALSEFLDQRQRQQTQSQNQPQQKEKATPVQGGGRAVHPVINASSLPYLRSKDSEPGHKLRTVNDDSVLEQDYQPPLAGLGGPIALPAGDTASKKPDREKKAIGFDYNESVYLAEAKRLIALKVPEHIWNNPDLIPAQMRGAITRVLTILLAWANFPLFKAVFGGEVMTLPLEVFRAEAGMQASRLRVSGDKKNKKGQAESAFYIMQYVGLIETVQSVPEGSYRPGDITLPGYILPVDFHRLKELAYELPKKRGGAIFTSRTFQEAKTNFYRLKSDVAALLSRELPEFNPWIESDVRAIRDIESQTLVRRYEVKEALTSDSSDLSQTLVRQQSNVAAQKGLTEQKVREESDVAAQKRLTQPRLINSINHEEDEEESFHGHTHTRGLREPNPNPVKAKLEQPETNRLPNDTLKRLGFLARQPEKQEVFDTLVGFIGDLTGEEPSSMFIKGALTRAESGKYSLEYLAEVFSQLRELWESGGCKGGVRQLEAYTHSRITACDGNLAAIRRMGSGFTPEQVQRRAQAHEQYYTVTPDVIAVPHTTTAKVLLAGAGGKTLVKRQLGQPVRDVVKSALKYVPVKPAETEEVPVLVPAEPAAAPMPVLTVGKLSRQAVKDCWPEVVERLIANRLPAEVLTGSYPECDSEQGSITVFLQKKHAGNYFVGGSAWRTKPIQEVVKASFPNVREVIITELY